MWRSWKIELSATIFAALCVLAGGCAGVPSSGIDPSGERIFASPPAVAAPSPADERYYDEPMGRLPGDDAIVLLTPQEKVARVGSEQVLVAGVGGPDGFLRTNRRLEWTIAAGSVGQFTAVEKGGFVDLLLGDFTCPKIVNNAYAVGSTGRSNVRLNRGTPAPDDDLMVTRGQGWISLTSAVEGVSVVTVLAPDVYSWDARTRSAMIHWVDAQWQYPQPTINPAGSRHVLTTCVVRQSDLSPCEGWRVRYAIAGGPPAGFAPDGAQAVEVPVNSAGRADAELFQPQPAHGMNQICIEIIRPAEAPGAGGRRLVVDRGSTTKTWSAPDLSVAITGPPSAGVGQTIAYRIELCNPGDLPLREIAVEYDLPDGLSYIDSAPAAEKLGNKLVWRIAELGARQRSAIDVRVRPDRPGTAVNCCRATAAGGLKAEGSATTAVSAAAAPAPAEIEVRIIGPDQVNLGDEVYFEITVTNHAPAAAAGLIITNRFDPGLEHKQNVGKNVIRRELGYLAPGQSTRLGITFQATRPGRLNNAVEVSGPGITTARASAAVTVLDAAPEPGAPGALPPSTPPGGETRPNLSLKITGPERHVVGELARFTIELTNAGAAPLAGLKVVNRWDPALLPKEATRGSQVGQNALTWAIDDLPAGKSVALTILCECRSASVRAVNRASVLLPDGGRLDDETYLEIVPAEETPPPAMPEIAPPPADGLTLTAVGLRNPVKAGNELTYEIRATNAGLAPFRQVAVAVVVPEGMTPNPLGTSPPEKLQFKIEGRTVRFDPVAELRPGETATYRVRVRALLAGKHRLSVELSAPDLAQPLVKEAETEVF